MFDVMWKDEKELATYPVLANFPPAPQDPYIEKAGLLVWEEHCVECAIPDCYTSCSLYRPRKDQKCRRFPYGIFQNEHIQGLYEYGADVFFLRWGKLEAEWFGIPRMHSAKTIRKYDAINEKLGNVANVLGASFSAVDPKRKFNGLYTLLRRKWLKRQANQSAESTEQGIDAFFIKFFYPGQEEHGLQIEFVQDHPVFRDVVSIQPGWNEKIIPYSQMAIRPNLPGYIRLSPVNDLPTRIIFTWLDFVKFEKDHQLASSPTQIVTSPGLPKSAEKVKCVVWDLDDTLWTGVIGDVGPHNVQPNVEAIDLIKSLDERGVLNSIASKNTYDVCWPKIEELGLSDMFLHPAIHWGQKSQSLMQIAKELNINLDTFAFIDDSPFERSEVAQQCPQVRCYDPKDLHALLSLKEFDLPLTPFSRERRKTYLAEAKRKRIGASWTGDYDDFLRTCEMVMRIRKPKRDDQPRCFELVQRTNQLNLSGRRLSQQEFDDLFHASDIECYAIECEDKFGKYGLVGFCVIEMLTDGAKVTDFVLSCRVAQKKIEETFFYWYASTIQKNGGQKLLAKFMPTDRNGPLHEVLKKIPFSFVEKNESNQLLQYIFTEPVVIPDVVTIHIQDL